MAHVKMVHVATKVPLGPALPAGSVIVTVWVAVPDLPQTSVATSVTVRVIYKSVWAIAPFKIPVATAAEPAGNNAPTVVFNQPTCTVRTCSVSSAGSSDTDGGIRSYTWKWGDATPDLVTTSTSTQNHTYASAGTFTITLVVTDNWGKTTTVTRDVTVT